jgi:2-polyprenyl-3-methyl-5-hydroxy-6-metoxy-1,4-benzoquinol methylase
MDGPGLQDPALQARVLADLARVNRLTRTHAPVLQFLRQAWSRVPPGQRVSVLDVGCGQGDLLRAIWALGTQLGRPLRLTGLDLHPDSTRAALAATPQAMRIRYVTSDVFAYRPPPTDYIVHAQLAHHMTDAQLVELLRWQHRHAERGWCVADLRRSWLPYLGFRWLARLAGWHPVVRLDGTLSIARSCTPHEWRALLQQAGVAGSVHSQVPFRLTVQSLQPPPSPPP